MGLRSRRPSWVPMQTARHRQQRMKWAQDHRDWTVDDWKKVAWSDESRFLVHHVDDQARIHRLPTEAMAPGCTIGRTQAGGSFFGTL